MKPILALAAAALVTLTACTERDLCINRATTNLRAAEQRMSELQLNIARGYAVHEQTRPVTVTGVCYRKKSGKPYECLKTEFQRVETPVAIDVGDQRKQLRRLKKSLPALRQSAAQSIESCKVQYPQ